MTIQKIDPIEEVKLDEGIKPIVLLLQSHDVETFESCQGGIGHCFPEPTVRFWGDQYEGLRVAYLCLKNALPIREVRRAFAIIENELREPFWEVTFKSTLPKGTLQFSQESGGF